jgi:hypothetical protein
MPVLCYAGVYGASTMKITKNKSGWPVGKEGKQKGKRPRGK